MRKEQEVAVFTESDELFRTFERHLGKVAQLHRFKQADFELPASVSLAFVDGKWGGGEGDIKPVVEKLVARAVYTVLVDEEKHVGDGVPAMLAEGLVDDLLLLPLRPIELLGKLKHALHLERVREVAHINVDLKTMIAKFEEDIRTARAIQRTLIPEKFTPVTGFKVAHKYLSGLKSGGDYLDFVEFEDKTHVGLLMTDSTGYGLSSAFMSVILKLAVKFSKDEFRSPATTIARIFEELKVTMKPKENLSIFYGILNRKTFELVYAGTGSVRFVHQTDGKFVERSMGGEALTKDGSLALKDQSVTLTTADRVVLFTDGFGDQFRDEGNKGVERAFSKAYGDDAMALINELVYRVKKTLESDDDMPEQDCSVMVLDVEKRAMRLAR